MWFFTITEVMLLLNSLELVLDVVMLVSSANNIGLAILFMDSRKSFI
jgi:hypothetical protein